MSAPDSSGSAAASSPSAPAVEAAKARVLALHQLCLMQVHTGCGFANCNAPHCRSNAASSLPAIDHSPPSVLALAILKGKLMCPCIIAMEFTVPAEPAGSRISFLPPLIHDVSAIATSDFAAARAEYYSGRAHSALQLFNQDAPTPACEFNSIVCEATLLLSTPTADPSALAALHKRLALLSQRCRVELPPPQSDHCSADLSTLPSLLLNWMQVVLEQVQVSSLIRLSAKQLDPSNASHREHEMRSLKWLIAICRRILSLQLHAEQQHRALSVVHIVARLDHLQCESCCLLQSRLVWGQSKYPPPICLLCCRAAVGDAKLRASHVIPDCAYKAVGEAGSKFRNSSLLGEKSLGSTQMTLPMLCPTCEGRFSVAENVWAAQVLRGSTCSSTSFRSCLRVRVLASVVCLLSFPASCGHTARCPHIVLRCRSWRVQCCNTTSDSTDSNHSIQYCRTCADSC
jgi:hypothetical protein